MSEVIVSIKIRTLPGNGCSPRCRYLYAGELCKLFLTREKYMRELRTSKSGHAIRCPACRKAEVSP